MAARGRSRRCSARAGRPARTFGGRALREWPWLQSADVSDLVEQMYDETWPSARSRSDVTPLVRELGDSLVGQVRAAERRAETAGPQTLIHGDASAQNLRTSGEGEVAFLDWEDLRGGPGVCDLAWLLVSSVQPSEWERTLLAYARPVQLNRALPAAAVQGVLSVAHEEEGSPNSREWMRGLEEAGRRIHRRYVSPL
ncbi:MAG: phosphotransferase [Candidatus Nanopelagicales bacterium]